MLDLRMGMVKFLVNFTVSFNVHGPVIIPPYDDNGHKVPKFYKAGFGLKMMFPLFLQITSKVTSGISPKTWVEDDVPFLAVQKFHIRWLSISI